MNRLSSLLASISITLLLSGCVTTKKIDATLQQARVSIGSEEVQPTAQLLDVKLPGGIQVDEVMGPSAMPAQSFSRRTGILVLPLILYYRFQTNHLITLGSQIFDAPIEFSFRDRLADRLLQHEDSVTRGESATYTLSVDLQSCSIQGTFAHGTWYSYYDSGVIDQVKPATDIRLRWILSRDGQPVEAGTIQVFVKAPYRRKAKITILVNGQRKDFSEKNFQLGPTQISYEGDQSFFALDHLHTIVGAFSASLDLAANELLIELDRYFRRAG